jgi:hypothetical protein
MNSTAPTGHGERRPAGRMRATRAMRPYTHFERAARRYRSKAPAYRPFRVHG